jgi:hypothetical protein
MHTRSAKSKITGKFTVTVSDWTGVECFRGEFDNLADADRAAAHEERAMTIRMQTPAPQSLDDILMSDDELLAALSE